MSHLMLGWAPLLAAALTAGGCYRDAAAPTGEPVTVRLVDGSSPAENVDRVEVYVTEVAASTTDDVPDRQVWIPITEPREAFEMVALPQGTTTIAGEGTLPAGEYRAVRLTIRTDSSFVLLDNGQAARVRWAVDGPLEVYALVERPLVVRERAGLQLVVELDLARSFGVDLDPVFDFVVAPVARALDAVTAGALAGTVRADGNGDGAGPPLANATVTVLADDPRLPGASGRVIATARTDPLGQYRVGFLVAGSYAVRVEGPVSVALTPVIVPEVLIVAGGESRLDVTLTAARASAAAPVVPALSLFTRRL